MIKIYKFSQMLSRIGFVICLLTLTTCHLELSLTRLPRSQISFPLTNSACQDPKTIGNQCKYQQICYHKDLAYTVALSQHPTTYRLALDLTTPISWIKGNECHIISTQQKCILIEQNLAQRINSALKHTVTDLVKKLRIKIADQEQDKAMIEGSNEIVMGNVQKLNDFSLEGKNTQYVSKWLDMILLGFYIIGEKDTVVLKNTTFMKAHLISPNLDGLQDGAISMRFDENAQNSFLNEMFEYAGQKKKIISIYLGDHQQIATIGNYETKYMREGLSTLRRIKLQQDDKLGKLAQLSQIVIENIDIEDGTIEDNSTVVFTLSASYLAFPKHIIDAFIKKLFAHPSACKLTPYLECKFSDKSAMNVFVGSNLNLDFDTSIASLGFDQLILKKSGSKKVKFNIRQSESNLLIVGEPFFKKYYTYFDYNKNEIGYTERALSIQEGLIAQVTLIRIVCMVVLFSCCMVLSSEKLRQWYYRMFERMLGRAGATIRRLRVPYRPVGSDGGQGVDQTREARAPSLGQDLEGL